MFNLVMHKYAPFFAMHSRLKQCSHFFFIKIRHCTSLLTNLCFLSFSTLLMTTMKGSIVLYPSPAIGHLISMVELGKLFLTHKPSLTIHVLITNPPYNSGDTTPYISSVSSKIPSIIFHNLPKINLPPELSISSPNHETLTFEVLRLNQPNVFQTLIYISKNYTIQALIMDFFCYSGLDVCTELQIPGYFFFTSGVACLVFLLYMSTIHKNTTKSLKDLNEFLHIPGLPPIHSSDSPKPVLDRHDKAYEGLLDFSIYGPKSAGIIVNTFEALEHPTVKAILDGLCLPDSLKLTPMYCIGPLIVSNSNEKIDSDSECLKWLDKQPSKSVVFLCFGSLGVFSTEQLKEIAIGLENSEQRFLWVVRNPPNNDKKIKVVISTQKEPDLDSLLPEGFLNRTKERGLVVKNWAPQVAVLNHESVGGFVTHCGWNSVLEAVCAGVPMVAWPLYAEQRLNRVVIVEDIKIALPLNEGEDGFVSGKEVEKRVKELMEFQSGDCIRKRTLELKYEARVALSEGGSSQVSLRAFLSIGSEAN